MWHSCNGPILQSFCEAAACSQISINLQASAICSDCKFPFQAQLQRIPYVITSGSLAKQSGKVWVQVHCGRCLTQDASEWATFIHRYAFCPDATFPSWLGCACRAMVRRCNGGDLGLLGLFPDLPFKFRSWQQMSMLPATVLWQGC